MTFPHAPSSLPAWLLMWSLALGIYMLAKFATWICRKPCNISDWRDLAYLFGWPGMGADRFLNSSGNDVPFPTLAEWVFAFVKLSLGLAMLGWAVFEAGELDPRLVGWVGMSGIVFCLHFGLFHLLSLAWRLFGLQSDPIMQWPIASQGLAEFWGRRWNLAFRDLTFRYLFRPLVHRMGSSGSLFVSFVVSGLIHELVISLPVNDGYGGPTFYFVVQAIGILLERSRWGRTLGLGSRVRGRIFCAVVLIVPLPLLFHRPFVVDVIVPFLIWIRSL